MTTANRPDPWDRLDAESDPAWAAFVAYRDMGLERSTAKVAKQLRKSETLMNRWSRTHRWGLRSKAYDGQLDREHRAAMQVARIEAEKRNLTVARALMGKAVEGIRAMDASKLKPLEVARMIEVGAKLEALALGTATDRIASAPDSPPGGGHVVDLSQLSDEDRRARLVMLRRELDSRLEDPDAAPGDDADG